MDGVFAMTIVANTVIVSEYRKCDRRGEASEVRNQVSEVWATVSIHREEFRKAIQLSQLWHANSIARGVARKPHATGSGRYDAAVTVE